MASPTINPIYGTQCAPVFGNTYEQCGGSFSRAQLSTLNQNQILSLFSNTVDGAAGTQFHENAHILKHQFEMSMCGIKRNGFYDWITSSNKSGMSSLLNWEKRDRSPMILRPFILGRQQSVVNTDYYVIIGGYTTTRSGTAAPGLADPYPLAHVQTGPLVFTSGTTNFDRVIRVVNGYGAGNLLDAGRFLADMSAGTIAGGHALYILNTIGATSTPTTPAGVAATTQWRIVDVAAAADNTFIDVAIDLIDASPTSGTTPAPNKDTTPTNGVVINGVNNVADVERYCRNPTNYTNTKLVPFWFQTYRNTRCVDSEYKIVQRQLLGSNDYYQQFVDLPDAERNRQDEEREQREFVHSFLFGKAADSNQTVNNWGSLPNINSVALGTNIDLTGAGGVGSKLIGKRAYMIGVYDQLRLCGSGTGQVKDQKGGNIEMSDLLENWIYNVYRARQNRGSKTSRNLVVWTDTTTANEFNAAWIKYSAAKTGIPFAQVGLNFNADRMDANDPKAQLGFTWRKYELFKPSGVTLEIVTHETFDDLRDMFAGVFEPAGGTTHATRGKYFLILDLGQGGTIYPATLASNRKVYTVGDINEMAKIDPTFSCIMEAPTQTKTLTSKTVTAIVNCPLENLWIENFANFIVTP